MEGYRDKDIAAHFQISLPTVRLWRRTLMNGKYIFVTQRLHCSEIRVNNWTDPRLKLKTSKEKSNGKSINPLPINEPLPNDEEWKPTPYSKLSTTFVNLTKIPELTGGARKWNEALTQMVDANVEPEDMEAAITLLREKGYSIVGPWSVVNTAVSEMSKRKSDIVPKKPTTSDGETAWMEVLTKISTGGSYAELVFEDENIMPVLKMIGGYRALCMATDKDLVFKKKDFVGYYERINA